MAKVLTGCLDAANTDPCNESETNSVSWNSIDFDALGDRHFEEMLWELAELNFRFKLATCLGRFQTVIIMLWHVSQMLLKWDRFSWSSWNVRIRVWGVRIRSRGQSIFMRSSV